MRCMVRGAWCVVRGAWCVVRGAWCVVRGAWCVVRGALCGSWFGVVVEWHYSTQMDLSPLIDRLSRSFDDCKAINLPDDSKFDE
jgi:hypothetical protein